MLFTETSAKRGTNVEEIFFELGIVKQYFSTNTFNNRFIIDSEKIINILFIWSAFGRQKSVFICMITKAVFL
jgi:hypothetical protein